MTLTGTVQNGVVVLDPGTSLPEGSRVDVILQESPHPRPHYQSLLELAGTMDELPEDMARNHDHYLYGAPKR